MVARSGAPPPHPPPGPDGATTAASQRGSGAPHQPSTWPDRAGSPVCDNPTASSPSKLSPLVHPFSPRERPAASSKAHHWTEDAATNTPLTVVGASSGASPPPSPLGLDADVATATFGPWGPDVASPSAPSSSLSPAVAPFFPECSLGGRTKSRPWANDDGEETDDDHHATYLEAARRQAKPATTPSMRA